VVVTPDDAIEAIRGSGGARPGYRALHAKGKLYRGTFTASPKAAGLSRAAHLDGSAVPTLIRFSNGSGRSDQRDGAPDIRGMAVKFSLPDGTMVSVGTLDIIGIDTEREKGGDIVVFDPMRVIDGIEPSDDPVLRFRTRACSASVKLRTGVDGGAEAPPE
jgi:catalase